MTQSADLEPGQWALVRVQFIEDRAGRALVRLPNGTKSSIPYDSLDLIPIEDDPTETGKQSARIPDSPL